MALLANFGEDGMTMIAGNPDCVDPKVLERVYKEVKDAAGFVPPIFEDHLGVTVRLKTKFFKVYKAPGYPVDPKKDEARALDGYLNAFAPQQPRTFDTTIFRRWLDSSIN